MRLGSWGVLEGEQAESRYHALAEQAADNASRIYVASAALGERVARAYERAAERIVDCLAARGSLGTAGAEALVGTRAA